VRCRQYRENSQTVKCLIVTHAHPDHATDANVMIEAMTKGMTHQKGYLLASKSAFEGTEGIENIITKYHKKMPKETHEMAPGDKVTLEGVEIEATKTRHRDPTTFGVKIKYSDKIIAYTSDTEYFDELGEIYKGTDILIINLMRPNADRIPHHLCTDDVIKFLKVAKPKLAIIQHFGLKMINANPMQEAQRISKESGVRTIAVKDGDKVSLEETDQTTLGSF
jgi:phosphoribosyl 1,2-cyclic phosphodiesterase